MPRTASAAGSAATSIGLAASGDLPPARAVREEHRARELEVEAARALQQLQDQVKAARGFDAEAAMADAELQVDTMHRNLLTRAESAAMRGMLADAFGKRASMTKHEMTAHVEQQRFVAQIDLSSQRQAIAREDAIRAVTSRAFAANMRTAFDEIDVQAALTGQGEAEASAAKHRLLTDVMAARDADGDHPDSEIARNGAGAPTPEPIDLGLDSRGDPTSSPEPTFGQAQLKPAVLWRMQGDMPVASPLADDTGEAEYLHVQDGGVTALLEMQAAEKIARETGRPIEQVLREMRGHPELTKAHRDILETAKAYQPDKRPRAWTTSDAVRYFSGDFDIFIYKDYWVHGYRKAILAAAKRYDLPPVLLAGVAYTEVGGDPAWFDDVSYGLRKGQRASFGDMSLQVRTAADALGYSSPSHAQQQAIIRALRDPVTGIFVAAKHLSRLRDRDFRGRGAAQLSRADIEVIATRYNRGSGGSVDRIRANLDYGKDITKRWDRIDKLLRD